MKFLRPTLGAFLVLALSLSSACGETSWVGKQIPKASISYLDGAKSFEGKPAVVEFWATWCGPCKAVIPHLNELNKKYKDRGLAIVGVSIDDNKALIKTFMKTTPIEYTVAHDSGQTLAKKLNVEGIPKAFVVDKTGKIVWEGHSAELSEEQLEAVLK